MHKMFKKAFDVPYEDISEYPTPAKAMEAISKYCEANGETCVFTGDDEVESCSASFTSSLSARYR